MSISNLRPKKKFKEENKEDKDKKEYDKIRRFYEIKQDIKGQLGANSNISPEQVIVSLCKLKPNAKSFNQFSAPILNSKLQATGGSTAKKFRSIINNHRNIQQSGSEVESIESDIILEEPEMMFQGQDSDNESFNWKEREKMRRSRISNVYSHQIINPFAYPKDSSETSRENSPVKSPKKMEHGHGHGHGEESHGHGHKHASKVVDKEQKTR